MVTVEMTDVERRGRISHGCLGLYSDANAAAAKRALDAARRVAAPGTKFGIQLAHAGRKASCQRPWEGGKPLSASEDAWPVVSASAVPYAEGHPVPQALDEAGIAMLVENFGRAAERAARVGFEFIELHSAHGYLRLQNLHLMEIKSLTCIFLYTRNYLSIPEGVSVATVIIDGVDVAPAGLVKRSSGTREPEIRPLGITTQCALNG